MKYLAAALGLLCVACGGDSTTHTAPSPPPAPLCQTQNSAMLTFENRSRTNRTLDVYLDNVRIGVIAPGQSTPPQTVAAGVKHDALWYVTNTNLILCVVSPIPVQCSAQLYYCDF